MAETSVHEHVDGHVAELRALVPRMIDMFTPTNLVEQREQFLYGEIHNPRHTYDALHSLDLDALSARTQTISQQIKSATSGYPVESELYGSFTAQAVRTIDLFRNARLLLQAPDDAPAAVAYDALNDNMFGGIDERTYRGAVNMLRQSVAAYQGELTGLQQEQLELLPPADDAVGELPGLPGETTRQKVEALVEAVYGHFITSVPEQMAFTAPDIAKTFSHVLYREFGAAAIDWRVGMGGSSINVNSITKTISIPEHREPVNRRKMQGLLVHELGVHALRAIAGAQTNFRLLQFGLPGNGDIEEGLAMVLEQATEKKYALKGLNYYVIAGLMRYEGYDFRAVHEAIWRVPLLAQAADTRPTEDKIRSAQTHAYNVVQRFMRGTDSRPWLKDLVYPNGTRRMWDFMETAADDPDLVTTMLMGKIDPTDQTHTKLLYEARSL